MSLGQERAQAPDPSPDYSNLTARSAFSLHSIELYCEHQILNSIEQQVVHSIEHQMLKSIPARIKVKLSQLFHVLPNTRVQLRDPTF